MLSLIGVILMTIIFKSGRYYYNEMSWGIYFVSVFGAYIVSKKTHWSAGLLFLYTMINSSYFSYAFPSPYKQYGWIGQNLFRYVVTQAQALIALFSISILFLPKNIFDYFLKSLPWITIVSSLLIIFNGIFRSDTNDAGIMGNLSMDPTLIGVLVPTLFYLMPREFYRHSSLKILTGLMILAGFFICQGSVGIGTLSISLCSLFLLTQRVNIKKVFIGFSIVASLLLVSKLTFKNNALFDDSNRAWIYKSAYDWFIEKENIWTGAGLGSYWGFGPISQIKHWKGKEYTLQYVPPGKTHPLHTWMHSDWLQIIFELGIIGFILSCLTSFYLIKNCLKKNDHWLTASVLSYMGSMVFNMPLHWFLTMFVGAVLFREGFSKNDEQDAHIRLEAWPHA